MKLFFTIVLSSVVCLLIGYVGSWVQAESLYSWYPTLVKPLSTPPNIVFPIMWSILYVFMGISVALIIHSKQHKSLVCINIFAVQLILNFIWSLLFFYLMNPLLGLIDIIILDIVVIIYIKKSYSVNLISSLLFIPYILWLLFATYLNGYIWIYN